MTILIAKLNKALSLLFFVLITHQNIQLILKNTINIAYGCPYHRIIWTAFSLLIMFLPTFLNEALAHCHWPNKFGDIHFRQMYGKSSIEFENIKVKQCICIFE